MNRTALGLAVGAGYLLGRTKKLKMALAMGSLVAGKKLNLGPRALADVVSRQLKDNPQFKEIGDQLRQDLRGVGTAASGAMVERQVNSLADRLHGRTAQVREQLSGATGSAEGRGGPEDDADAYEESADEETSEDEGREGDEPRGHKPAKKGPAKKAPAKKAPAKKASAKRAAPAKKAAAKKTDAARRAVGKKTAAASRQRKGGGDR
ncbi:primase [Streptomyces incarnatus]|uniref:Primase n=1 Tax=Streptomyces incarnatus TaxID=665007 RepID=A0ABM5TF58_9ACTN|nr:DNA primase [Streptomyces incarnatus]AKJ09640.1 primase [Streptomyces incarnatus]